MPKIIAITGNIGSGKTTAARILETLGATRIDADQLARDVVEPGTPALAEIRDTFGDGVLDDAGRLDRPALGRVVFADPDKKRQLEAITHPRIREAMGRAIVAALAANPPLVALEIPLLFEGGMQRQFADSLLVVADDDVRLNRVVARDRCSREDALARMRSQMPQEEKLKLARWVVRNDGDEATLRARLSALWPELTA